ncbi:hypothetical protein FQA39_LY01681 [Lamprigera yunnana]|nr:hypothetical protein FQA39_LY01681 [Lamprigera yunnana]
MSRRGLSYEELLKELEDLPQYESDCELPSNNNSTDEDSDFVIDVPESQKSSSDSDETTPPLSTLTRRNSNTDIATQLKILFLIVKFVILPSELIKEESSMGAKDVKLKILQKLVRL